MPRSRRPQTSQSSRPSTAADDYAFSAPGTASSSSSPYFSSDNPQPLPAALHAHYAHFQYPDDEDNLGGVVEEEDEGEQDESEDEDVFAYLPPTTAEQQNEVAQSQLQLHPPRTPQQVESPPETTSSFDHYPQGPDALHMRPVLTPNLPQNDASPPYTTSRPPIHLDTSTHGVKRLHVTLPTPIPGPSQPPQSYFLPGSAYDNPYQFTLSQMSTSVPPSTQGSTFTSSEGLRLRHNINVGVIRRTRKRDKDIENKSTDGPDYIFKEPSSNIEGSSIAKLVGSDLSSLEYGRRSHRLEDSALDELDGAWSHREGSIKCVPARLLHKHFLLIFLSQDGIRS